MKWSLVLYKLVTSALPIANILPGQVQAQLLADDEGHNVVFWQGPGDKRRARRGPGRGRARGGAG
eukprot:14260090-Heterocapsa_arctica.AAC.1